VRLSAHRGFLAGYKPGARGRARLIAHSATGHVSVPRFRLPAPPFPRHRQRRPGAVFADEIGETIIGQTYAAVVRRFGPPALTRGVCVYYEVVGDGPRGWRFCFAAGRVRSATGNEPIRRARGRRGA
jgi:hypothetical protein